jgi:hypothetical protein
MFYFFILFFLERDDDSASSLVFVLKDVKREKKGYIKK